MRQLFFLRAALAAFLVVVGAAPASAQRPNPPTVVFLTDFGTQDGAVAVCKGVMWNVDPRLRIVDLTHEIPPYDIETAGEVIEQAIPFYPSGTVFVAVVDPGVGTARKPIAVKTRNGHFLVGPDNGMFTRVMADEGVERAVELRNDAYFRVSATSSTFHGRDIFSPVAAHLAIGTPLDSLGPPIVPMQLDLPRASFSKGAVRGTVRYIEDPYGNVVTDIPRALMDSAGFRLGDTLTVRIGARTLRMPWKNTFGDVAVGRTLAVIHSRGVLSFSVNQGNFADKYATQRHAPVVVTR
jgi:S-adenosylmethionine hydrolase